MIEIVEVIYEFHNKETETANGVYKVNLNGKPYIFIRNDDSVGVVSHYLGKPASECISIIRDDVKRNFLTAVKK
jgi:hypothetical protein